MKKKSLLEIYEETGTLPKWKPEVGAAVQVFEDPITQHIFEGTAKVVKIHSNKNGILDCDVRFDGDSDIVRRQIKYK